MSALDKDDSVIEYPRPGCSKESTVPAYGGFCVPIEIKFINETIGSGIFSTHFIKAGTLLWTPTLVQKYSPNEVIEMVKSMTKCNAHVWIRQAFVLHDQQNFLCVNITDYGRFMNHSSNPSCGYASESVTSVALRDILPGDEMTCDYSGLASPEWYKQICVEYNVLPTDEVARRFS